MPQRVLVKRAFAEQKVQIISRDIECLALLFAFGGLFARIGPRLEFDCFAFKDSLECAGPGFLFRLLIRSPQNGQFEVVEGGPGRFVCFSWSVSLLRLRLIDLGS